MKRLMTAFALVVIGITPLAWLRGRTHADGVAVVSPAGKLHVVALHRGRVVLFLSDVTVRKPHNGGVELLATRADYVDNIVAAIQRCDKSMVNLFELRCTSGDAAIAAVSPPAARLMLVVPTWGSCLIAGVMLVAAGTRRRVPHGHCSGCGYDLRASDERCPECGQPITANPLDQFDPSLR